MKISLSLLLIAFIGTAGLSRLGGQEIIVSDLKWTDAAQAGDLAPAFKTPFAPVYPPRLKSALSGYAILWVKIDGKGNADRPVIRASFSEFASSAAARWTGISLRPAQKAGQPVDSSVWFSVIFNASNTSPKTADAQARILAVAPVIRRENKTEQPSTVPATVSLDETGVPRKLTLENASAEALREDLEASLQQWKFAPARKNNQPVPTEMPVVFLVMNADAVAVAGNLRPAKPITTVPPVYPTAMRRGGLQGNVTVECEIDEQGQLINAAVVSSSNPSFNDAALTSVRQWKFMPAMRDGKAEATKMQIPIVFTMSMNGQPAGREATQVNVASKAAQEKLPLEYRYDIEPRVKALVLPVYPYQLLNQAIRGSASVAALVDERGRVAEIKVLAATHPAFGQALAAAVGEYFFVPAMRDGRPTKTLLRRDHKFDPSAENDLTTKADLQLLAGEKKNPAAFVSADSLDRALQSTVQREPQFPALPTQESERGEAVVEFLLGEDGSVRLPRVLSATEEPFGYAAVQAVAGWRFEPPLVNGKPTIVRVQMPVKFVLKEDDEKKAEQK